MEPSTNRTAFLWAGAVMTVVVIATVTAFVIIVLFGDDDEASPPATPEATPTTVNSAVALRSGPAGDTAINGNLQAGTEVRVIGRSESSDWLFVEVAGPPAVRGWVPLESLTPPPDVVALTVSTPEPALVASATATATPGATTASGQPTFTPDLPDLAIESVFSRDNRVVVVVTNVGVVDLNAEVTVSIDGGSPHTADIKPGEPILPDDQLEIALDNEYVQRRALITVTVATEPAVEEGNLENNTLETVISPDLENDLSIATVAFDGPEGALRIELQNNSSIPVTGAATITVRENSEERTRLGVAQPLFELAPGEVISIDFPEIVELTADDITVRLSSDAVNDADPTNNVFPQ